MIPSITSFNKRAFAKTIKLTNIGRLVGFNSYDKFFNVTNQEIILKGPKIEEIGSNLTNSTDKVIDLEGAMVTPSFIDPHTHIFPPKDRANEFALRVKKTYQEIAQNGGGIMSSVKACRSATFDELFAINEKNILRFIAHGTTTLEMKSGYGLNLDTEILLLEVINALKKKYKKRIEIIPTFLGAHAIPEEYKDRKDEYVDLICTKMIPQVAEKKLALYCDVFCENGYFNFEDSMKILKAAKLHKLKIRIHADEFEDSQGAYLAYKMRARSADHLMAVSDKGIQYLFKSDVVATMLPGTTVFLGQNQFAPVRKMIDAGVRVAIATDYNPGSSVFNSQALMMNFAMAYGKLTLQEAFKGVTRNAALSLKRSNVGIIEENAQADLLVWNLQELEQIPYYNYESSQYLTHIIKRGAVTPLIKKKKQPKVDKDKEEIKKRYFTSKVNHNHSERFNKLLKDLTQTVTFDSQNRITNIPESQYILDANLDHAPKRTHSLNEKQIDQAIKNHLKYFSKDLHEKLDLVFREELNQYGHIYMFNYMPRVHLEALPIYLMPGKTNEAKAMMHMILNNLDPKVAQFPQELITYGSNGAVFSNWAQFHITMKYLSQMDINQCLHMYSGHPMGLFPKLTPSSPAAVISNGQIIPYFQDTEIFNNLYALGVTMYGQMTAGSWMYIGPQGIIHGTAITVAQAAKLQNPKNPTLAGKLFVTSGLGGMSGAQAKATTIGGGICLVAEINPKPLNKRHEQGYLDEKYSDLDQIIARIKIAKANKEAVSIGYLGNTVDMWEKLAESDLVVEIGSDQSSLHNPYFGGYYPAGLDYDEANELMTSNPELFKDKVHDSLRRQIAAINKVAQKSNMFFFDYGNAMLFEAQKAGADVLDSNGEPRYRSYIESILGPEYFDYGFGPYRWVCTSADEDELYLTDQIARDVLENQHRNAPDDIKVQIQNNIQWIKDARNNKMTVGSQARILYSDTEGRIECAIQMNKAIRDGRIKYPIVIGRDHHDVSGTDAPLRETSNIYDGSSLTADMAVQNVIGDAMRGATWVSLHNGGGTGWGKAINGGFGMVLDGSQEAEDRARAMLFYDVTNGLTRRARAGNVNALKTIQRLQDKYRIGSTGGYFPFIPSV